MLACSFLIESSSKLLVTRTGIKARTSLISGRIRLLTLELLALEWRKFYTFELEYLWGKLANLDQILCVASLGVRKGCIMFWGRLDQNSGAHGNRKPPLTYNGENGVSMLARLFLIESSSKLLVTRTGIKARTSLISGRIRLLTLELLALEWRKFHIFKLEYLWSQLTYLDQILCVASMGWGKGCIRFWGRLDQNSGFHGNRKPLLTYNGENDVSTFSWLFLIWFF